MDRSPFDFSRNEPMDDTPMDLSPIDLSGGPIDLTTFRRRPAVQDEPPKRLEISLNELTDMQKKLNLYSGGISMNTNLRPLPLQIPFEAKPISVSGSLSSPPPLRIDARYKETSDSRVKLASPMTSPSLYSPPIIPVPPCSTNALGSLTSLTGSLPSLRSSPLFQSPGFDMSTVRLGPNKRYMSASRPFNILAKKLIGDIDCPPRPGHRQGTNPMSGGTGKRDKNESEAAYRERRSKNNLAARRSRDKRKKKCDLLIERAEFFKEESYDILKEIMSLHDALVERGYHHPLPFGDEVQFAQEELYMYG